MADTVKIRQSNMEMLRIFSMLLIVMCHYATHGVMKNVDIPAACQWQVDILKLGGGIGVDVFVLISGFFMVKSSISGKKILRLWVQIISFVLGFYLLFRLFPQEGIATHIGVRAWLYECLPVLTGQYWFISTYVLLMLLSPFLNRLLHQLPRMQVRWAIIVLGLFATVSPCLPYNAYSNAGNLGLFILLYTIAGYIRLYAKVPEGRSLRYLACAAAGVLASVLVVAVTAKYGGSNAQWFRLLFTVKEGFYLMAISLFLFYGFWGLRMPSLKWVNTVAACTFGVYLIHDNPFVRPYLWKELLNGYDMSCGGALFLHCIVSVSAIYVVCTLIALVWKWTVERCYIRTVEPRLLPHLQRFGGKLAGILDNLFNRYIDRS